MTCDPGWPSPVWAAAAESWAAPGAGAAGPRRGHVRLARATNGLASSCDPRPGPRGAVVLAFPVFLSAQGRAEASRPPRTHPSVSP